MNEIYCCIRGEGFNEQWGEGRTYYKYYLVDNVFDNVFEEVCLAQKYPDNYDLEDDNVGDENAKKFVNDEQLSTHILSILNEMSNDKYYYKIYFALPKEIKSSNMIKNLNLQQPLDRQPDNWYTWRNDDKFLYYLYPIKSKHYNLIKNTKRCKTSKKEECFIEICKKILPDLSTQQMFTFENKNYYVDGFSESKNIIIEFLGDYYHGNPDIYDGMYYNDKVKKTAGELYNEWDTRKKCFELLNYKVIYIWENEYDKMTKKDITHWLLSKL